MPTTARQRVELDHVGAEVGEEHAAERSGDRGAEVEDPDPLERVRERSTGGRGRRNRRVALAPPVREQLVAVRVDVGGRRGDRVDVVPESVGVPELGDRAEAGHVDGDHRPVVQRLRMTQSGVDRFDGLHRDVGRAHDVDPLGRRALAEHGARRGEVALPRLTVAARHREDVDLVGVAAEVHERGACRGDHRVEPLAVGTLEARGRDEVAVAPQDVERIGGVLGALPDLGGPQQRTLEERRLDALPRAGALAREQRGVDARGREQRGAVARQREAQEHRAVDAAGLLPHQPRTGLHEGVPSRAIRRAAGAAVPGDGAVDEARVAGEQRVAPDAEALRHAGREALEHHVGAVGELEEAFVVAGVLQVEHDAAPAAQPHRRRRERAERVTAGRFDLDDVGAVVGEQHAGEGPGHALSEVEDPQSGEHGIRHGGRVRAPVTCAPGSRCQSGRGRRYPGGVAPTDMHRCGT